MTAKLSVNLNKIALLRNSRPTVVPNMIEMAKLSIDYGAQGITLHPRSDQRHIRPGDVNDIAALLQHEFPHIELNIEGNPLAMANGTYPGFMSIARHIKPTQCTLVPDSPNQITSDHGWAFHDNLSVLQDIVKELHDLGCRVSIFTDFDTTEFDAIEATGTDRIELYTEPYARAYETGHYSDTLHTFVHTATTLHKRNIGINAGHDLNLDNLAAFSDALSDTLLEVSIGHALTCDALKMGWQASVEAYLERL